MHNLLSLLDAHDHIQPVNSLLYAMSRESLPKPTFYPSSFKDEVDILLWTRLGITRNDIDTKNIEEIYIFINVSSY